MPPPCLVSGRISSSRCVPPTPNSFAYSWTPPGGLSNSGVSNPTANFTNDVTYTVTVTGGRCAVSDTLNLSICTALPVEELELTGDQVNSWVDLKWRTLNEENTDFFVVQRSYDNIHFEEIGQVDAAGENAGQRNYPFRDEHPYPGVNYYRIKLVDQDGATEVSNTLTLQFTGRGGLREVFPNPLSPNSSVYVNYWSEEEKPLTLSLFDLRGVQVQSQTVEVQSGINRLHLEVGQLPEGVYLLNTRQGTLSQTTKLMILE